MGVIIKAIGHYLPKQFRSTQDIEELLVNNGFPLSRGLIEKITGIKTRPVAAEDQYSSTLAVEAIKDLKTKSDFSRDDIDLLIFASATQDLIEPATSHIIQAQIGTQATCFDVKNACNSFLNGIEVATALLKSGSYSNALVVTGEKPSVCLRDNPQDRDNFKKSFAGYTFGDSGAAFLLTKSENENSILYQKFVNLSTYWDAGMLPGGGTRHPRGDEYSYFQGGGFALKDAFTELGPAFLNKCLEEAKYSYSDFKKIYVHQVSKPFLNDFLKATSIPCHKVKYIVEDYGNLASASLPLALSLDLEEGQVKKDDRVLLIGLAGGISLGISILRI